MLRRAQPVHLRVDRVYTPVDRIGQPVVSLFWMLRRNLIPLLRFFPHVSFIAFSVITILPLNHFYYSIFKHAKHMKYSNTHTF